MAGHWPRRKSAGGWGFRIRGTRDHPNTCGSSDIIPFRSGRPPALLVDNQVNVSLAVSFLDISQAVKFLGKGTDSLAQESKCINPDCNFTQFCPEHMAGYPDDISPFDELV